MAEVVDAFAHVIPEGFFDELAAVNPSSELDALRDAPRFWDMSIRLELMDTYGVDRQVLTLARPPIWQGVSEADAIELTRYANDAVREIADEHEEFIPVATLPFVSDPFKDELDRCLEMGMAGVQLFSNTNGGPIDSADHRDIYRAVEDAGVPIWLHPQLHTWHEWDSEYMLHKLLGWPFDTSMAMARLVFSGIMEEHSDLQIITHHTGAMIPHFINRLEIFHRMQVQHRDVYPYEVRDLRGKVRENFSRFYADTCRGGDAGVLEDGLEFFGSDSLVFATDYPFGPEEGEGFFVEETAGVERMDIDDETRADVMGRNLNSLLGRS